MNVFTADIDATSLYAKLFSIVARVGYRIDRLAEDAARYDRGMVQGGIHF